jgi:hypothetical protein
MQRLAAMCKAQMVSVAWGRPFKVMALKRDLRSLFKRVNRYQVDHNYRKLKHYLDEDVHRVVLERESHPVRTRAPRAGRTSSTLKQMPSFAVVEHLRACCRLLSIADVLLC